MTPTESEAIEAFERLGLTSYEAKVFIALQRVGSGTARDVARATDVPRSQVYSVAESLEERGLLEVQQSNPIRYRGVPIDQARAILEARLETERDRAFSYVESIRTEAPLEEEREAVWTVRGSQLVSDRIVELLDAAEERIVFGSRLPSLFTDEITALVLERADDGLDVTVICRADSVRDRFGAHESIAVTGSPSHRSDDDRSGRILIVDDDRILLSVVDDDGDETAIWSADSLFASVLIQLIEESEEAPTS